MYEGVLPFAREFKAHVDERLLCAGLLQCGEAVCVGEDGHDGPLSRIRPWRGARALFPPARTPSLASACRRAQALLSTKKKQRENHNGLTACLFFFLLARLGCDKERRNRSAFISHKNAKTQKKKASNHRDHYGIHRHTERGKSRLRFQLQRHIFLR